MVDVNRIDAALAAAGLKAASVDCAASVRAVALSLDDLHSELLDNVDTIATHYEHGGLLRWSETARGQLKRITQQLRDVADIVERS